MKESADLGVVHSTYYVTKQPLVMCLLLLLLNKNSLAVNKVQGQSEATMVISDQNL